MPEDVTAHTDQEGAGKTAEMHLVKFKKGGDGDFVVAAPDQEVEPDVREAHQELRADTIKGIESRPEGIDVERAKTFVEQLGLTVDADIFILDSDDYSELVRRCETMAQGVHDGGGFYVPGLNIIAVHRDPEYEERFGLKFFEYELVHELAHASAEDVSRYTITNPATAEEEMAVRVDAGRMGQVTTSANDPGRAKGLYLEEGFADTVAHSYLTDILKLEHGFSDTDEPMVLDSPKGVIELPAKYLLGENGGKQTLALFGVDFLRRKDPTLLASLVKARRSPEGLREVAAKINAIGRGVNHPDLYNEIRSVSGNATGFANATRLIIEALEPELTAKWDAEYGYEYPPEEHAAVNNSISEAEAEEMYSGKTEASRAAYERLKEIQRQASALVRATYGRELTADERIRTDELNQRMRAAVVELNIARSAENQQP